MPDRSLVEAFVARVESGDTLAALRDFYAPAATVRENQQTPRIGLDALLAHEQVALDSVQALRIRCVRPLLIEAEHVVIRWSIRYTTNKGHEVSFEELALQCWRNGKIESEQFFYDPAQFSPRATAQQPCANAANVA